MRIINQLCQPRLKLRVVPHDKAVEIVHDACRFKIPAAAGLAQVVFGYFEAPSVVDDLNGFVVWDDAQFEARLAQLVNDPHLVARMGGAGIQLAQAWEWDRLAPLWEQRILETADGAVQKTYASRESRAQ